jgi:hypothetical protein
MDTNLKSTSIPQSNQTNTEGREKVPTFHLQTGLRAGAPNTDEKLILAYWEEIRGSIENFFDRLPFGNNA